MIFDMKKGGGETADKIKYDNAESGLNATDVQGAIDEVNESLNDCFQSVSDGKSAVATALTNQGVSTSATATFATMATNIGNVATNKYNAGVTTTTTSNTTALYNALKYSGLGVTTSTSHATMCSLLAAKFPSATTLFPGVPFYYRTSSKCGSITANSTSSIASSQGGGSPATITWYSADPIDVTQLKGIRITYNLTMTTHYDYTSMFGMSILSSIPTATIYTDNMQVRSASYGTCSLTLDVSGYTGKYYIVFSVEYYAVSISKIELLW